MNILLQALAILFFSISCPPDRIDSLSRLVRPDFELVELNVSGDSLLLVSTNEFLYYPFGKFTDEHAFNIKNKIFTDRSTLIVDNDDVGPKIKLSRFDCNASSIITIKSESNALEIVKGSIRDKGIELVNGVFVGMKKDAFLSKFFIATVTKELKKVNTIVLESGLQGIWHYYYFKDDILDRIQFRTDYSFYDKVD
jgi:hypothetical protein